MRWFSILLFVSATAHAEVYRCEQNGQMVYTDRPCSESATPKELPKLNVVPPSEVEQRLAGEYDRNAAKDKKARDQANREWLKQHKAEAVDAERLKKARLQGKVITGMSAEQVREIYGEPDTIKKSERKGITKEVWTYHRDGGVQTVDLESGRVARHSDKKSIKRK